MIDYASVTLIDGRGWLLMQERDEHTQFAPEQWCFPGGGLEQGEPPLAAAVRELAEETGLKIEPDDLTDLGRFETSQTREMTGAVFVARTDLTDADVQCHEGRQITFVDPARTSALPLTDATRSALPVVLAWRDERVDGHRFAGVLVVNAQGHLLLQERDADALICPEKWGLPGGHLDAGETFEAAAYREVSEETGLQFEYGELDLWRIFSVDHQAAYGGHELMAVYVAAADLTDSHIVCGEGRQIVFVDPDVARGLDLTSAAGQIIPEFLESRRYRELCDEVAR